MRRWQYRSPAKAHRSAPQSVQQGRAREGGRRQRFAHQTATQFLEAALSPQELAFAYEALKQTLSDGKTWLALLADQHAGDRGLWLPFLGRECSCSASPAVFALRARHPLITAVCYRTGLARWRWEFGDWIPDSENGRRRSVEAITRDINAVFEAAIRRDPANWFWVHRRWKPPSPHQVPQSSRSPASSGAPVQKAPVSGSSSDSLTS